MFLSKHHYCVRINKDFNSDLLVAFLIENVFLLLVVEVVDSRRVKFFNPSFTSPIFTLVNYVSAINILRNHCLISKKIIE